MDAAPARTIHERFDIQDRGSGTPPIVFGNGFGTVQGVWGPLIDALDGGRRVVTFDPAGASPRTLAALQPSRHDRIEGFAEDLLQVIESVGERVIFVGHSFSGMAGMLAALAEPALFRGVVLIGASARYIDDPGSGYVGGMTQAGVDSAVAHMKQDFVNWSNGFSKAVAANPGRAEVAGQFAASLRELRPDVGARVISMILRGDYRDACVDYGALGIPTLSLHARVDAAVAREASQWLAQATGARSVELDLEGHFPHVVDPPLVAGHISDFLGQVP